MTSKAHIRKLTRIRVQRHRALSDRGLGVYDVKIHHERLAEVLMGWGMPKPLTWRRDMVEGAIAELMDLILTDKDLVRLLGKRIAERRSRAKATRLR
jgi:hypothetical protein